MGCDDGVMFCITSVSCFGPQAIFDQQILKINTIVLSWRFGKESRIILQ